MTRKKIAILGSTGSIGKTLLKIVEKDKKSFEIAVSYTHIRANDTGRNIV